MSWVKVDDRFTRGRKVKRAARALGGGSLRKSRGRVLAVWLDLMSYCASDQTDGFFPDDELETLPDPNPDDVLKAMEIGDEELRAIVTRDGKRGGWQVRNYGDYQPLKSEIEAQRKKDRDRKRAAKLRESGGIPDGTPHGTARGIQRPSEVPSPAQPGPALPLVEHDEPQEQPSASFPKGLEAMTGIAPQLRGAREPDENNRVLLRLAHDVLIDIDKGDVSPLDTAEELKTRAADARIAYTAPSIRAALASAEAQRVRQSPAEAALRLAADLLRPVGRMEAGVFKGAVYERAAATWPTTPAWRDEIVALLWGADWWRLDAEKFGADDDGYFWRMSR